MIGLVDRARLLARAYEAGFVDTDTVWEGPEEILAAMRRYEEQEEQKNEL